MSDSRASAGAHVQHARRSALLLLELGDGVADGALVGGVARGIIHHRHEVGTSSPAGTKAG